MIKFFATLIVAAVLMGCAAKPFYTLGTVRYDDENSFQAAVDAERAVILNSVKRLPSPVTNKKLIVAFAGEAVLHQENLRRHEAMSGKPASSLATEQSRNLAKSNYKLMRATLEAVERRGIYTEVIFREMPSLVISIEPSSDADALFYSETGPNAGQYFYSSVKHGKQVFAFDRSAASTEARTEAFIQAVQAMAIRN